VLWVGVTVSIWCRCWCWHGRCVENYQLMK
jgi:hypothetical protein